jgi:hypothetical protein
MNNKRKRKKKRNTAYLSVFSWKRNISFWQNGPIQESGINTVAVKKKKI